MLPGLDAMPLKREFKRLMSRSLPPFMAAFLESATDEAARNSLGLGAGADIASAATLDLTAATGQVVRVTGTVATDTITMNKGVMFCIADAAWPLTYHATTNPVQGGASYTCEAGDVVVYMKDGSDVLHNWIISPSPVASTAEAQAFADNTKIITPLRLKEALQGANQSLASSGYQKLPGGLIIQWGTIASASYPGASNATISATFPVAFPTACVASSITQSTSNVAANITLSGTFSTTGFSGNLNNSGGGACITALSWFAIGY